MSLKVLLSIFLIIICQVCGFSDVLVEFSQRRLSEDGRFTFTELANKYGHPGTEYEITTEDGYILTVFRLPGDVNKATLLIHGNTPTGDCWITRGYDSLAITLANQGHDVWALNLRGTRYSRKHVTLDPDNDANRFFNYSFYEQAVYDVPAVIDFILEETGQEQLIAVGHSAGTTMLYIMGAEKPEYNEKIKIGISLAPISFMQHIKGSSFFLMPLIGPTMSFLDPINVEELASYHETGSILRIVCLQPLGYDICIKAGLLPAFGYNEDGLEREFIPTLLGHAPGGTSRKIVEHFWQIEKNDRFAKFDYGEKLNLLEYGSPEPPKFDLSKVTMKSALFIGKEDYLATVEDAERLNATLPNVVYYEVLEYDKFSHSDFIWGRRMTEFLYPSLLEVIKKYT